MSGLGVVKNFRMKINGKKRKLILELTKTQKNENRTVFHSGQHSLGNKTISCTEATRLRTISSYLPLPGLDYLFLIPGGVMLGHTGRGDPDSLSARVFTRSCLQHDS